MDIDDLVQKAHDSYRELVQILQLRENELKDIAHKKAHSPEWEKARKDRDAATIAYSKITTTLARTENLWHISNWLIWGSFFVIAVLEVPYNKFAFDNILKSTGLESYIVSFAVTLLILLIAHFAGKEFRQFRNESKGKILWGNIVVGVLLLLVLLFVIATLTIARAYYAQIVDAAANTDDSLFGGVAKAVTQHGVIGAFTQALENRAALAIFSFNILGIVFAFIVSYFTHDPDKDLDNAYRKKEKAEKKIIDLEEEFRKAIESVESRYKEKIDGQVVAYNTYVAMLIAQGVDPTEKGLEKDISHLYKAATDIIKESTGETEVPKDPKEEENMKKNTPEEGELKE